MRSEARRFDRPWVGPEVSATVGAPVLPSSDLRAAIERLEHALDARSVGRLIHALVAVRAALRSRATLRDAEHDRGSVGSWKRRLRRRYAASMCAIERLLEAAWTAADLDTVELEAREELTRLRRLESLEDSALLDQHWTDLGIGD